MMLASVLKAVVFTPVAVAAASGPIWSLVLVVVSAVLTGLFALIINERQIKENRRLHARLDALESGVTDVARHTETDRRVSDPAPEEDR